MAFQYVIQSFFLQISSAASLSERLPRALLRLDALLSLSLPRNNLSGPVLPSLLAALPRLRSLDLSSNRLAALTGVFDKLNC